MRNFLKMAAAVAVAAGVAGAASAGSVSTPPFQVSVVVAPTCTITASPLAFGTYSGSQLAINTTITTNCPNLMPYNVGLNAGTSGSSTVSNRHVQNGANTAQQLSYGLYQDAAFATNWGNTVGVDTVAGTGTGNNQSLTVYGRVAASQTPPITGVTYTDQVIATVTF